MNVGQCDHIPLACIGSRVGLFSVTLAMLCTMRGSNANLGVRVGSARHFGYRLFGISYTKGALDGGSPMSPVDFKKWQCPLSLFLKCPCRFLNSPMSSVHFKKRPCHPVEFKGQGPHKTLALEV